VKNATPSDALDTSLPVACEPQAVPEHEREAWIASAKATFGAVEAVHELVDGYAYRLDPRHLTRVAEYVGRDRLCCKYVHWSITVEQDGGPLWLAIRGPEGTKAIARQTFEQTDLLPSAVAHAAGFSTASRNPIDHDVVSRLATPGAPK